jgi:hypothetical protein
VRERVIWRDQLFLIHEQRFSHDAKMIYETKIDWTKGLGVLSFTQSERFVVARHQPDIFAILESQGPIAIELDLVKPIAFGEFVDRERLHRGDECHLAS